MSRSESEGSSLERAIAHNGRVLATLDVVSAGWRVVAAEAEAGRREPPRTRRRRRRNTQPTL